MRTRKVTQIGLEVGDEVEIDSPGLRMRITVDRRNEEPSLRTYCDIESQTHRRRDKVCLMSVEQDDNGKFLTVIGVESGEAVETN